MTVQMTGNYGGPQPESVSLAARLTTADEHLSYADLETIAASTGADMTHFRAENLVEAGFSGADAQRIMQALGEDFMATRAGSRVESLDLSQWAPPAGTEKCLPVRVDDRYRGQALAFADFGDTVDDRCIFAPDTPVAEGATGTSTPDGLVAEGTCAPAPAHWKSVTVEQRQVNLRALQEAGLALLQRDPPADGVEVWSALTDMAAGQYADSGLPPATQADFVMQDLAIVLMGPDALGRLDQYADGGWVGNVPLPGMPDALMDPLVQRFRDDFAALGLTVQGSGEAVDSAWRSAGYIGSDLDPSGGAAFRPELRDTTHNQTHHTFAYQYITYVTNSPAATEAGSLGHELLEGGGSRQDHNAGMLGRSVGEFLRSIRDQGSGPDQWGLITSAAYGNEGGPRLAADPTDPMAQGISETAQAIVSGGQTPGEFLRWSAENGGIALITTTRSWIQ